MFQTKKVFNLLLREKLRVNIIGSSGFLTLLAKTDIGKNVMPNLDSTVALRLHLVRECLNE